MHISYILLVCIIIGYIYIYSNSRTEGFTPRIYQAYRPYVRTARSRYESFINYFTKDKVIMQLKKWNIY
jgi:hypothetical protein